MHPAHQSTGVGRMLKLEQRRRAREMGLDSRRLGVRSAAGQQRRLQPGRARREEPHLRAGPVRLAHATRSTSAWLPTGWSPSGRRTGEPSGRTSAWPDAVEVIEAPAGRSERRARAPARRRATCTSKFLPTCPGSRAGDPTPPSEWQTAVRQAFQAAFTNGYVAVGFTRQDPSHPKYVLERSA